MKKLFILFLLCVPFFASALPANKQITGLYWDPVTSFEDGTPVTTETIGYFVYYREPAGAFLDTKRLDVGNVITNDFSVFELPDGVYYFTVTAYEDTVAQKVESAFSNELKIIVSAGKFFMNGLSSPKGIRAK